MPTPGVNVPCTPSAAPTAGGAAGGDDLSHDPFVLRIGPVFANQGHCVFGLNYGETSLTTATGGVMGAMGDIPTAAPTSTFR